MRCMLIMMVLSSADRPACWHSFTTFSSVSPEYVTHHHHHHRSKIWRQHRVPQPRFPQRRKNFGDSRTFKADIALLIFAWTFRTSWTNIEVLGQNGGRGTGWCHVDPKELVFTFGVLTFVPILVKITQKTQPWECPQTDTLTDANRFYNLSHAICYSYETDNHTFTHAHQQQNLTNTQQFCGHFS